MPATTIFYLLLAAAPPKSLDDVTAWHESRATVVVFVGVECPLAKLYATRLNELSAEYGPRGVRFFGVDANRQDSPAEIARFAAEYEWSLPLVRDVGWRLTDRLGATRTPEAFLLDDAGAVRYQGRIDDGRLVGLERGEPTRRDLAIALDELLAGRPIAVARTKAVGCRIGRTPVESSSEQKTAVTYCRDVAPIFQRRCVVCHREGQIGPFAMTNYDELAGWADTIAEVVEQGRMPPWHANPAHGHFANDPTLTDEERATLLAWARGGAPEGNAADLSPSAIFPEGWTIGEPDLVLSMAAPFIVPAEGVIEYQQFQLDPRLDRDTWIAAVEIQPGNRAVVHHVSVYLTPPGTSGPHSAGTLGSFCLATAAAGTPPLTLPPGMAKLLPAGWRLLLVMHYTVVGTPQSDVTSVGLKFVDPCDVRKEVATWLLVDEELRIPPREAAHRVERTVRLDEDMLLLGMFPHMHLRGKSFRYEAELPDGRQETLLDVPRWDFNWQHRYELAEPKLLPAGTTVRCVAVYDNSAANPANPDPSATVRAGSQSWDEMFNGYLDVARVDEDRSSAPWPSRAALPLVVSGCCAVMLWRRKQRSASRASAANDAN